VYQSMVPMLPQILWIATHKNLSNKKDQLDQKFH
jgi:hypothetical protein